MKIKHNNSNTNINLLQAMNKAKDTDLKASRSQDFLEEQERYIIPFSSVIVTDKLSRNNKKVVAQHSLVLEDTEFNNNSLRLLNTYSRSFMFLLNSFFDKTHHVDYWKDTINTKKTIIFDPMEYIKLCNFKGGSKNRGRELDNFYKDLKALADIKLNIHGEGFRVPINGEDQFFTHITDKTRAKICKSFGINNSKRAFNEYLEWESHKRYCSIISSITRIDNGMWEVILGDWIFNAYGSDAVSYVKIPNELFDTQSVSMNKRNTLVFDIVMKLLHTYGVKEHHKQDQCGIRIKTLLSHCNITENQFKKKPSKYKEAIIRTLNILERDSYLTNKEKLKELTKSLNIWDFVIKYRSTQIRI